MEIATLPIKIMEFELRVLGKAQRVASTAIYQTFSSTYIAEKRMAEAEAQRKADQELEARLDAIGSRHPAVETILDIREDHVIDIRDVTVESIEATSSAVTEVPSELKT